MMARVGRFAAVALALALVAGAGASAGAVTGKAPPARNWSFDGPFGTFDRASLQRGLQVYIENCSACHSLDLVAYRNLADLGFSADEIKTIAAENEVTDGPDEEGEMFDRPARPADRFVAPFPNDAAARASNGGALPPDLSLLAKSRIGGPDYLAALLAGYAEAPADHELPDGMNYNPYFPGGEIAMPPPLFDDLVEYADGTKATVDQMAADVSHFLMWAAEPKLEVRQKIGWKVVLFLIVLTALLYASKRKVWANLH